MSGIRTPLNTTPAIALGNKKWVKEILRTGPLHYNGKVFDVTSEYLDGVAQAYQDGAIKRVPFQLAGKSNEHDESPERRRGFIEGVFREGDKLKSIIDLEDEANHLVETDKSFPVSVLIKHDRTHGSTGQHWDAVLTHVLGTYDPVLDLDDWEPYLAASNQDDDVIDFLALAADNATGTDSIAQAQTDLAAKQAELANAQRRLDAARRTATDTETPDASVDSSSDEGATNPSEGIDSVPTLSELLNGASEDELKALREKLDALSPAEDGVTVNDVDTAPSALDDTDVSDDDMEEAEAIVADLFADDTAEAVAEEEPAAVAASQVSDSDDKLALANAQLSEQGLALAQMRRELNDRNWERERDALVLANVPPVIVELAKPFLHGSDQRLALSEDGQAKAAVQVRKMLNEIGGQLKLGVGATPTGSSIDAGEEAEKAKAAETRSSAVSESLRGAGVLGKPRRS